MLQLKSVKTRMIIAFSILSVFLALVYSVLMTGLMLLSEDAIFERQLSNEQLRQQAFHQENGRFDEELSFDMQLYDEQSLRASVYYDALSEVELGVTEFEEADFHVAVFTLYDQPPRYFIIYDVANQEIDEATSSQIKRIIVVAFVAVSITGIVMGIWIGGRSASPIERLDQRVNNLDDGVPFGEPTSFGKDEVGRLARSFAAVYERTQQFVVREKRFTREVSHELRTPITVIRGALDILALQPENPKALGRIRRACDTMQQMVDTFLILGREENLVFSSETMDALSVCQMIIDQHQKDSFVPIHFTLVEDPQLHVLPPVFAILLGNLLDNAVRHTPSGLIRVSLDKYQLWVEDTGCGFPATTLSDIGKPYVSGSSGQGLGLSIVERICKQFGWTLEITSEQDKGSRVSIRFR